jgi:hypothetical protein
MKIINYTYMLVVSLLMVSTVSATCNCPSRYVDRGGSNRWLIQGCNDVELQGECKRGEWELENWIGAIMGFGDAVIKAKLFENPPKTATWVANNRAALSDAVEYAKPVVDCNKGVFTQTRNPNTVSHCLSPQVLEQCKGLLEAVPAYQVSVIARLIEIDGVDPDFISLIRVRTEKTMTIDVSCETSEKIEDEVNSGEHNNPAIISTLVLMVGVALQSY